MGGRERRAMPAFPRVVATLEERTTAVSERASEERLGAREGHRQRGNQRSCSLDCLFSKTGWEEPFAAAEGPYIRGLIGSPKEVTVEGTIRRACTLVFLFIKTALEEPFTAAERFSMGRDRKP